MNQRTALVTGASRGIGLAISMRLQKEAIKVLTPTRQEMDLFSNSSIDAYLSSLKEPIDILINNAGINILASGVEVSDSNTHNTLQVNLIAPMRLIRSIA
ncbi:unnamed protein product, partial [marine sediment metagenome]